MLLVQMSLKRKELPQKLNIIVLCYLSNEKKIKIIPNFSILILGSFEHDIRYYRYYVYAYVISEVTS